MRPIMLVVLLSMVSLASYAQLSASASVPIVLRIPGSITLSLRSVPVSVSLTDGAQRTFTVPLALSWNLNPAEVQAFRVVAYFQDSGAALTNPTTSTALPATKLLTRWGTSAFAPFASDATASLFHTSVFENRRGEKQDSLELKIDDAMATSLPNGSYEGTLYLEVRHY